MFLPVRLLKFWYLDSLALFVRTWTHLISFLEEDLAVGLMLRLLFVPLFHDASLVGRILSFCFRFFRIWVGFIAYALASILVLALSLTWFALPFLVFWPGFKLYGLVGVMFGLGLFLDQVLLYPSQPLWHVKTAKNIWLSTKLKKSSLSWNSLNESFEVSRILESLELGNKTFAPATFSLTDAVVEKAYRLAISANAKYVTESYFWLGFLSQIPDVEQELLKHNFELKDVEEAIKFFELKRAKWRKVFIWDEEFSTTHLKGVNRGWLGAPTRALDSVSTDLTRQAARFGFDEFLGRQSVVNQVVTILSQSKDHNVWLLGEPGSGRSCLIKHLAQRIIQGNAPEALATKRIVELSLDKLLSGVKTEGDLAQNLKMAFEELEFVQNTLVVIDEIQNFGMGEAGDNLNLYALLLPFLESENLQFIVTSPPQDFDKIIAKQKTFARVFTKVELPPATPTESLEILKYQAIKIEREQKIGFSYLALKEIVEYADRLDLTRVLPDSALAILNESVKLSLNQQVTSLIIKKLVSSRTSVPVIDLNPSDKEKLLHLGDLIHQQFIDQEEAVLDIVKSLQRSATSLRDEQRPIGSFLFIGPTGVGKTELAKTLSEIYFKGSGAFLRFDMSEYQTVDSIDRLIGSGDNLGQLTQAVLNKPYSLILLDEFEKAEPKLLNLFLQVLDDGRLTDSSGKTVDFSNTIIIATSNVASLTIAEGLKNNRSIEQLKQVVQSELLKVLKPELVNRFDEIVIFKPLSPENLEKIVKLKLAGLQEKLKQTGYLIEFAPELITELAKKGFDPVLGARPLRRLIQDSVEAKLSEMILKGQLNKGEKLVCTATLLKL